MKIFHISDLHIGKQLVLYSLSDIQRRVLDRIVEEVDRHKPDVLIIAGDIYDKSVPSGEAYDIFDTFLNKISEVKSFKSGLSIPVLIIAGNHDNPSRLNYASSFMKKNNIHIATFPPTTEEEHLQKIVLQDEYGMVNFYLLPFTKPGYVRNLFGEDKITDYNTAVRNLIERENIDYTQRNVLVAHQFFVSGQSSPEKCDSEMTYISVGGIDSVDVECVRRFDYVALGHIHGAQRIGEDFIRYSGTPLKYSVSEQHHKKGITVVQLGAKGSENVYEQIPLNMKPDVRCVSGSLAEVIDMANDDNREDYVSITLTDDNIYRPKDQLEEHYRNILEVKIDNARVRARLSENEYTGNVLSPMEAFAQFYQEMNGQPLSEEEEKLMLDIISKAGERTEQGEER